MTVKKSRSEAPGCTFVAGHLGLLCTYNGFCGTATARLSSCTYFSSEQDESKPLCSNTSFSQEQTKRDCSQPAGCPRRVKTISPSAYPQWSGANRRCDLQQIASIVGGLQEHDLESLECRRGGTSVGDTQPNDVHPPGRCSLRGRTS